MKSNTLSWLKLNEKNKIVYLVSQKKVILAPSDTVFGLCGLACKEVFDELNHLKGRTDKPFLVLARSVKDIAEIAHIPEKSEIKSLLKKFWPGPLTVIFKAKQTAPDYLVSKEGTIAVRIPKNDFLQELLGIYPLLFSTSANRTGKPVPSMFVDIDDTIKHRVAAVVSIKENDHAQSIIPSTIIDISGDSIKYVREGVISQLLIQSFLSLKVE